SRPDRPGHRPCRAQVHPVYALVNPCHGRIIDDGPQDCTLPPGTVNRRTLPAASALLVSFQPYGPDGFSLVPPEPAQRLGCWTAHQECACHKSPGRMSSMLLILRNLHSTTPQRTNWSANSPPSSRTWISSTRWTPPASSP